MLAWLESVGLTALFKFLWGKLTSWFQTYEKDQADQKDEAAKAAQDLAKAGSLTPNSSKKDQEDAARDAFKHL